MQTLEIDYYLNTIDESSLVARASKISIEDHSFAHGGFGEIFHVVDVDGIAPEQPLVLKLFFNNSDNAHERLLVTSCRLCDKIKQEVHRYKKGGKDFFKEYPSLIALPLCVLCVYVDGIKRNGYVMYDLAKMNLVGLDKIADPITSEDNDLFDEFDSHDLGWRMKAAFHLVRGFHLLEKIGFVHADISADNIFIGRTEPMAVILDYDSGAVIESTEDDPTTFGKMQSWLAPEILFQLKERQKQGKTLVDVSIYSDRWAVANAIVQILTSLQPYYLTDFSEKTLRKYKNSYQWPTIDTDDDIFMEGNEEAYEYFIECYNGLPDELQKELNYTFNKGLFTPWNRTSYARWEMILKSIMRISGYSWSPNNHRSSHTAESQPQPSPQSTRVPDTEAAKEELRKYMDVLIMDIISGDETIADNKLFIGLRAKKAGVNVGELINELNDFIDMFNGCRKHKASQFELKSLRYQGSRAFISLKQVNNIIDRYCK